VWYLDFLRRVHEVLEPPTYLEIGVRHGDSLALAQSAAAGIDPAYELETELPDSTALFRETSDDYFDRDDVLEPFGGRPASLAFIDGMHLIEFALRDFINVERCSDWTGVVVFDDIFPREIEEAARKRKTRMWTGDVYKIVEILGRHRPDLVCLRVDTEPTGLLLVLRLDPQSSMLDDRYDDIIRTVVAPDPQRLSPEVVERHGALDPEAVLSASFWSVLRAARARGATRDEGDRELRRALSRDFRQQVMWRPLRRLLPTRA
jgi:hypothetical protein